MTSLRALVAAYLLGGLTFIPLLICASLYVILYVTPPIGDPDPAKRIKNDLQASSNDTASDDEKAPETLSPNLPPPRLKPLQGWLIARRTFEESPSDATYMGMMRSFLDSRSKDRRPRDTYYAVLKGTVLYLYEDEAMSECFAALDAGAYNVEIWPHDGLLDGELFAKRNSIRLSTKGASAKASPAAMASVSKDMKLEDDSEAVGEETSERKKEKANKIEAILAEERSKKRNAAFDLNQPWHLFVKNNSDMEDWYLALVQASSPLPAGATDPADPLGPVFSSDDMAHLVATLDAQPDAIPTRWLNALLGRLFFSVYRTARVEAYILGRLASKLAKVKRPGFLTALSVREVSVGSRPPTVATPMLKELTRWGDAALELKFMFDGEIRLTIAATAEVSLGTRFRPYVVQLVLAVVVRKVEGNVLVKVKRPPSNRIWYAFTSMPKLEIDVLPVVSDREIKWGVVLKPIETQLKEIIRESIVMPNMDDIPFFESGGYEHRGGIWPDAVRRQYSPENDDPTTTPNPAIDASLSPDTLGKASSSAPPSVMGLNTDASQTQSTVDLPPISESTPTLPLSPKTKPPTMPEEPKSMSTDGLVPAEGSTRSRTPSPVGAKADSTGEAQENVLKRDAEKEKEKPAPTLEVVPSKRMSWFSRTPLSASPSPSPVDTSRGRSVSTALTGNKSAAPSDRARSTPRSPVLLEVEGDTEQDRSLSSPVRTNAPTSDAESTSRTPARTYSPPRSDLPTQDTLSDDQSASRGVPAPTGGDEPLRSTTPIVTVNGARRTTVSHHASQSASGNFYSGSVSDSSSSSLPPTGSSPTATYSDSEIVKGSIVSTPIDAPASSATSSLHTPSDVGFAGSSELARTFSNSSTNSLSAPIDTNVSQATSSDTNTAPNSASFLATWKTRAADKQALSNTAKEAMKKWSVGWNNLKKGVEDERERRRGGTRGDTSGMEDEGSGSDAGMGGVGTGAAKKGTGRKTYAELRADVLSRREGAPASSEIKNGSSSTQHDSPFSGGLSSSPTPSNKSRPNSISVAPSAPKTTTEVHTGAPDILEQPKPIIEQPKPRPIGVQPGRGATMMIPGIHASHQGEVMSLGSAPAEKEPVGQDKAQDKAIERERTLSQNGRPSSIQNVYRLFGQRTISTSSNDASNLPGGKVEIVKQPKAAASSASIDTISITPVDDEATDSPFSPSTPRIVAPTLPPRPVPMMSVPAPRSPPPTLPPRKQSVSAASEALKKLAADDAARTSRPQSPPVPNSHDENASGASTPSGPHRVASPPPLPPRAPVTAS